MCFANFFRITTETATSVPIFEMKSCERTFSSFSPLCSSIFSCHFVSCLACRTHRDINEPLNLSDSQNKTDTFLHSYRGMCVCGWANKCLYPTRFLIEFDYLLYSIPQTLHRLFFLSGEIMQHFRVEFVDFFVANPILMISKN